MNLHDHLEHAVGDTDTDLHRLTAVARRQGTRVRRRRAGAAVLGGVAAVAVLAGTVGLVDGGTPSGREPGYAGQTPAAFASGPLVHPHFAPDFDPENTARTGRITNRGATAALIWSLRQVDGGQASNLTGEGPPTANDPETYSTLQWHPADGGGLSVIGLNLGVNTGHLTCRDIRVDSACSSRQLSDGSRVTTYNERVPTSDGDGIRRIAVLSRPNGFRIALVASNGYYQRGSHWHFTRPLPGFTAAQLAQVVQQKFWGARLPTYFLKRAAELVPYVDDGTGTGTASTDPTH